MKRLVVTLFLLLAAAAVAALWIGVLDARHERFCERERDRIQALHPRPTRFAVERVIARNALDRQLAEVGCSN